MMCLGLFPESARTQDIVSGLIVHYPMDEDADDVGPNNLDGQTDALPTLNRWGIPNKALIFNGSTTTLIFPNNAVLKPQLPITISFWVWLDDYSPVFSNILTTDYTEDAYYGVWFNTDGTGRPAINFGEGTPGQTNSNNRRSKVANTTLALDTWYMITGVIRGANDMDIYVNCQDAGGNYSGIGGPLAYSDNPGNIGRVDIAGGGPYYFSGRIDDFRYWNRALTQQDVELLYDVDGNLTQELTICEGDTILYGNQEFSAAGTYTLEGLPGQNCSSEITLTISTISNNSDFEIEPDTIVQLGSAFNFNYFGTIQNDSLNSVFWDMGNGSDTLLGENIQYTFPDTGIYNVTMLAVSDSGCISEVIKTVKVYLENQIPEEVELNIPNVISPNGDGKNDFFVIDTGESPLKKSLTVYNRWGNLLFEEENYFDNWSPEYLSDGVYFYLTDVEKFGLFKGTFQVIKGD